MSPTSNNTETDTETVTEIDTETQANTEAETYTETEIIRDIDRDCVVHAMLDPTASIPLFKAHDPRPRSGPNH